MINETEKILLANGFPKGTKVDDIHPPCAHTRMFKDECGNRCMPSYEKPCKMIGANQRHCGGYEPCMELQAYRNQFKGGKPCRQN